MREIEDLVKRLRFFWAIGNPRAEILASEAIDKLQRLIKDMKDPVLRQPALLICPVCGEENLSSISMRCSSCESISDIKSNSRTYADLLDAYKGVKIKIFDFYREEEEDSSFANTSLKLGIRLDLLEALYQLEGGSMPNNPLILTASIPDKLLNWIRQQVDVPDNSQLTKVSFKDFKDNCMVLRLKFSVWKDENDD
ncbi:MAG: hypothetical protein ACM3MK_14210 [Chitinophagales bacterium]